MPKILTLLAPGFEETEAVTVIDLLRRAGIETITAAITADTRVTGSHNIIIVADVTLDGLNPDVFDGVFLPGGQPGSNNLKKDERVLNLLKSFYIKKKWISAICAAPLVLQAAGILKDRRFTSYPGEKESFHDGAYTEMAVVTDGNLITSRGVGTAIDFALSLVEILSGKENRTRLAARILWK